MSNSYGFDFLKQQHNDPKKGDDSDSDDSQSSSSGLAGGGGGPPPSSSGGAGDGGGGGEDGTDKSDLEKQFDVINFLQTHRSRGCLTPATILRATGIDLSDNGDDENVARMLVRNPKIRTEDMLNPDFDPDEAAQGVPGKQRTLVTYGYQAKFNISDKTGLLAQINRCKNGVASRDLMDAYDDVEQDLASLITGGEIVAVANPEDKDKTLFPRGEPFFVEIEGNVFLPQAGGGGGASSSSSPVGETTTDDGGEEKKDGGDGEKVGSSSTTTNGGTTTTKKKKKKPTYVVSTDTDARKQIRRGEAIWIGGQWFRVSSSIREGPLSEQPPRAQAPPTVSMRKELSRKNEVDGYIRPFTNDRLPTDASLSRSTIDNLVAAKEARATLASLGISTSNIHSKSRSVKKRPIKSAHHGGGVGGAASHHPGAGFGQFGGGHGRPLNHHSSSADAIKKATSNPALEYCQARRHGCTTDIKDMYLATKADIPAEELDLYNMLVAAKLLEEGEAMRRPRMKKLGTDGQNAGGKPKKRRYYEKKNQRLTNTHLEGTVIGAALARATERQQQGKSVGDGGM